MSVCVFVCTFVCFCVSARLRLYVCVSLCVFLCLCNCVCLCVVRFHLIVGFPHGLYLEISIILDFSFSSIEFELICQ